ncbi:hypothetical protein AVEN_83307-1, partial [Araneus ventricosus]
AGHPWAAPRKSIHYRSFRSRLSSPTVATPPLACKARTLAGSDFLSEHLECSVLRFSHSQENLTSLSSTYLHRSHFSIYGLAVLLERLDLKRK